MPLHRAPVIESFRLKLTSSRFKPENINLWVAIAVSHCLRELEILYESDPDKPIILLSSLFTCKSLAVLKLDGDILLDVPRMVSLPSLKTLKLVSVRYFSEETLLRLLSSSPILEDLVVDLRENDTMGKLIVAVPSLQSLSLYIPRDYVIDGNLIDTPSLKYFKLMDHNYKSHDGLIENMPYLIEAYVDCCRPDINSLIGSITSVRRLAICLETMLDEGFVFNQLEHLEVCVCKDHSPNQLFRLLKASSNLQGLHLFFIEDDHNNNPHGMEDWNQPSTVPDCMLSSLQSFKWSLYTGEPKERDIVVYFLKHAVHLKTATIKSYQWDVPKFEMLKELSLSSRASTACQLVFD
ncbi:PREDICTED: FBD-associated F-box protein At4g10400-like [Brassica oleracea var. oleracea]|uniref:FBD domain-containing protein n=1 Tax=Brassica oleracea var. oleracea TaxID=109376 RepID=A0A0D3DTD0_BRAOL|nr:PREDICTED: FBD-associated F-box protein At4g10400-like [Brassica oleracea var. oleracea]